MAEVLDNIQQTQEKPAETVTVPDMFDIDNWKTSPTIPTAVTKDPVIEEKDKKILEEKPISDKPNEPDKIPTATPEPIQDRPDEKKDLLTPEPLKFVNEESEKVYNLIKEGKIDDLFTVLSEQKKLSTADKLPPADIIKLNLQYQNKDFSPQEINELFEDTYVMPEKPVQGALDDDEDFQVKMAKYESQVKRIESRIARDAKPAASELLKLSKEIVLPDIPRKDVVINEPTQEELAAQKVQHENLLKNIDNDLNSFNGYKSTFKDEEVTIPVEYKLSKEEKSELKPIMELAMSANKAPDFLKTLGWIDKDGALVPSKILQDLPFILNKEKVIQKFVIESGNRRHEASIKSIKNIDYGGNKSTGGDMGITPEQARQGMENAFFI